MERRWLNETHTNENGNVTEILPDENGDYTLEIVNSRGNRISTFKGKSMIEVNEKMAEAQVQANRQLGRLLKPDKGREPVIQANPQEITPGDRLRYASDLQDPNRVVETVEEIVTKRQGVPPLTVGQRLAAFDSESAARWYQSEAEAFMGEHPDYYPTIENKDLLWRELQNRGLDPTRNNLAMVYDAIEDQLEFRSSPSPSAGEPEVTPPHAAPAETSRLPVSRSSGLRHRDATAAKPAPPKPKPIVTRADLEKMTRIEFEERLRDPAFRRAVDAM